MGPRASTNEDKSRTLDCYVSPISSPKKKREMINLTNAENQVNGAVLSPAKKRRKTKGRGTAASPLALLSSSSGGESSRPNSALCEVQVLSSKPKPRQLTLGLERISHLRAAPKSLSCDNSAKTQELFVNAIVGRSIAARSEPSRSKRKRKNKTDLGIPVSVIGVSRKQLKVTALSKDSVTLEQFPTAGNHVRYHFYNASEKRMNPGFGTIGKGQSVTLKPGDTIELDTYKRTQENLGQPQYVFRVVRMHVVKKRAPATPQTKQSFTSPSTDPQDVLNKTVAFSESNNDAVVTVDGTRTELVQPKKRKLNDAGSKPVGKHEKASTADSSDDANRNRVSESDKGSHEASEFPKPNDETKVEAKLKETVVPQVEAKLREAVVPQVEAKLKEAVVPQVDGEIHHESSQSTTPDHPASQQTEAFNSPKKKTLAVIHNDTNTQTRHQETQALCPRDAPAAEQAVTESQKVSKPMESTDANQHPVRPPAVGERFGVWFEACAGVFGTKASGWFFGTATKVEKDTSSSLSAPLYKVSIQYDDNAENGVVYPGEDVERLEFHVDSGVWCNEFSHVPQLVNKSFAYDPTPKELFCGDLVDCRYQNGACKGSWYRGRVAAVSDDEKLCDVAYDDGEYERDIPIENGNFHLVKRGLDDTTWLHCQHVTLTVKKAKKAGGRQRRGKVDKVEKRDGTSAIVRLSFSDKKTEEWQYSEVVSTLFNAHRRKCVKAKRVRSWPVPATAKFGEEPTVTRESNESAACDDEIEQDALEELPPMVGNALLRQLDSSEPHLGAEMLKLMTSLHGNVPHPPLGRFLLDTMMHGPKSEGTPFPDPNRMEVTANYYEFLAAQESIRLPDSMCPTSWETVVECLSQATNLVYRAQGDVSRLADASTRRTGHSLQVAFYAARAVELNLKRQLKGYLTNESAIKEKRHRSQPIVDAILCCPGGIREALKSAVRLTIKAWVQNGHFLFHDVFIAKQLGDRTHVRRCSSEARHCLDSHGVIISYVAWLYCAEEGIKLGAKSCALLIRDAVLTEIQNSGFDPSPFLPSRKEKNGYPTKASYWKKVKLWFLLSLEEFVAPLMLNLGTQFHLKEELSLLGC